MRTRRAPEARQPPRPSFRVQYPFGNFLHAVPGDAGALLDRERVVGRFEFDERPATDFARVDARFERKCFQVAGKSCRKPPEVQLFYGGSDSRWGFVHS